MLKYRNHVKRQVACFHAWWGRNFGTHGQGSVQGQLALVGSKGLEPMDGQLEPCGEGVMVEPMEFTVYSMVPDHVPIIRGVTVPDIGD